MLSLAYRIATVPVILADGIRKENVAEDINGINTVPKIRLDNVHEFFMLNGKNEIAIAQDVPNWAPPFEHFWAEWIECKPPREVSDRQFASLSRNQRRIAEKHMEKTWMQVGAAVFATELDDEKRQQLMEHFVPLVTPHPSGGVTKQDCADGLKVSKWAIRVALFVASNSKPFCGSPGAIGAALLFVTETGKLAAHALVGIRVAGVESAVSSLMTLGLGISFMHCKNVRHVEQQQPASPLFHSQYKVPVYTYRTLQIDPMKEVLRREGKSDETGLKRALHICRGHFSTYSDDKPLFGKYPGTFWIPDHVRGSKEAGKVEKDYKVMAP